MGSKPPKSTLSVRISPETRRKLDAICLRWDTLPPEVVTLAIDRLYEREMTAANEYERLSKRLTETPELAEHREEILQQAYAYWTALLGLDVPEILRRTNGRR